MSRTGPLPRPFADETWRYAIVGGAASIPLTALLYWQPASELSIGPALFGGVVAGYLCDATPRRSGVRAGVIGTVPALWLLFDLLGAAAGASGPAWFRVAAVGIGLGATLAFAVAALGLAALTGAVGATFGNWLSKKFERGQPPAAGD